MPIRSSQLKAPSSTAIATDRRIAYLRVVPLLGVIKNHILQNVMCLFYIVLMHAKLGWIIIDICIVVNYDLENENDNEICLSTAKIQ